MTELKVVLIQHRKPLLFLLVGIAVLCWFLGSSFINLVHNKIEYKRLQKLSVQLDRDYEQLQKQLELLNKQDPAYIEYLARVRYHMSQPGETEYRFTVK